MWRGVLVSTVYITGYTFEKKLTLSKNTSRYISKCIRIMVMLTRQRGCFHWAYGKQHRVKICVVAVCKFCALMTSNINTYLCQRPPKKSPLEKVVISLHFILYKNPCISFYIIMLDLKYCFLTGKLSLIIACCGANTNINLLRLRHR